MSWRVVIISKRSKLDYKMGSMVVRSGEEEHRIHLGDISVIICETTAVSITAYLLSELINEKIKIIFCDNQHNPHSELIPLRGAHDSSGKIRSQIAWNQEIKARVWQRIIQSKIKNQATNLEHAGQIDRASQLRQYATDVEPGDITNREGHAAKVYFNSIFGEDFYRDSTNVRNAILDYGYSILLAAFNREISASGYLTQLGIWHDSSINPFNLGCDLMESFRPIVDNFARTCSFTVLDTEEKHAIVDLLNHKIGINNSEQYLNNAIGIYARSVFKALESGDPDEIMEWYEL